MTEGTACVDIAIRVHRERSNRTSTHAVAAVERVPLTCLPKRQLARGCAAGDLESSGRDQRAGRTAYEVQNPVIYTTAQGCPVTAVPSSNVIGSHAAGRAEVPSGVDTASRIDGYGIDGVVDA